LRTPGLGALVASALAGALLCAPAFAETPRDPLAAAIASYAAFDEALAGLKPPVYRRQDRELIASRLAGLKRAVDAIALSDAERASPKGAALERLRKAVADADERERAFWTKPPAADGAFPDRTAEPLRRDDASIHLAFTSMLPAPGTPGSSRSAGAQGPSMPPSATARSIALAKKNAGRSISDPNRFFDGETAGTGGVAANAPAGGAGRAASTTGLAGHGAGSSRPGVSDLRVAPVPNLVASSLAEPKRPSRVHRAVEAGLPAAKTALRAAGASTPVLGQAAAGAADRLGAHRAPPPVSRELAACRQAAGGGLVARLCSSPVPMIAPAVAGFGDAFKEQFGTAAGWASTAVSLLLGIVLPAVMGGVGILFNILRAICSLAVLWAIGALVRSLYTLYREFTSTKPDDPRHWLAARQFGAVCGKLLLTIVLTIAGVKIGSQPGVKGAVMSGLQSLQAKLVALGGGTAAPSAMASTIRGAFGEPEGPPAKPAEPAIKPPPPPPADAWPHAAKIFRSAPYEVLKGKLDYLFGRVSEAGREGGDPVRAAENARRSQQNGRVLRENGIEYDEKGIDKLAELFKKAFEGPELKRIKNKYGVTVIKTAELPSATLEVSFFYPETADGVVDFSARPKITSILPKEHR